MTDVLAPFPMKNAVFLMFYDVICFNLNEISENEKIDIGALISEIARFARNVYGSSKNSTHIHPFELKLSMVYITRPCGQV